MALELNSDIAVELNITARKGDSFLAKLSVEDENGLPYDLRGSQSSGVDSTNGQITAYQGKMTIKKAGTEFEALNVYSYWWKDKLINNVVPTLARTGHWSGDKSTANGSQTLGSTTASYAGIWFKSSGGNAGDTIQINIPSEYMNLPAGVYEYDFQTRNKTLYTAADSDSGASYTTWMYGTFTITNDITKQ
jgi:hypothetical protein